MTFDWLHRDPEPRHDEPPLLTPAQARHLLHVARNVDIACSMLERQRSGKAAASWILWEQDCNTTMARHLLECLEELP